MTPVYSTDNVIFNNINTHGNVTIDGNLAVNGTTTTVNSITVTTNDPLMHLADSNDTTDALDIGFIGQYYSSANTRVERTGFFRDATDGQYRLFTGLADDTLDSNNVVDIDGTGFALADLNVGTLRATAIIGSIDGFDSDFASKSTDDLSEGSTNLYYTTARADSDAKNAISAGECIDYNASTGEISAELASETNLGVATFDGTNFTVTSGDVTSNDITFAAGDDVNGQVGTTGRTLGGTLNIFGDHSQGIVTSSTNGQILVVGRNTTNTTKGVVSFGGYAGDSAGTGYQFTVTNGDVRLTTVDGGVY